MKESDIQSALLTALQKSGFYAWRVPVQGVKRSGKGRTKSPMTGHPDVAGVLPNGRYFVIECKTKDGIFSDDQLKWQNRLINNRVIYLAVKKIEDIQPVIDFLHVKKT